MAPLASKHPLDDGDEEPSSPIQQDPSDDNIWQAGVTDDLEFATPRPSALQRKLAQAARRDDLSSQTSSSASRGSPSTSGRSSPSKRIRKARTEETGFTRANFSLHRDMMPPALQTMCDDVVHIGNGRHILPGDARDELSSLGIPPDAFAVASGARFQLTRYPSRGFVARTHRRAVRCDFDQEGESSWNQEVHGPLLSWVCRPDDEEGFIDFRYCTSAGVVKPWKPANTPSSMVDYCMVIRPDPTSAEARAIATLKAGRPGDSINHTDWGNLMQDPIVVSIETKAQGGDAVRGTWQMATWQACQWRSLRDLDPAPWRDAVGFLPGIFVQGHEWFFVASIPGTSPLQSVYFDKIPIGTTSNPYGICKILAALHYLRSWAEELYWPMYRQRLLATTHDLP
ncbi:uncharacterized protein LY79DRAFT_529133 [Colletotrichum navitas]|uniref:PD-(D/E)XK nuclease-like domain-containing protein n=1 Tax=Colletotrichum navitas TaxID=681940 RepID=A0AAD8UW11_9PEZI|nr:uncharacterized protein LY79DRAFT_529133 [Colletotrichum navitas]KAK1566267.1 hypothetical protein LY79DRAFT_529133 [Colletotrichum navitas]